MVEALIVLALVTLGCGDDDDAADTTATVAGASETAPPTPVRTTATSSSSTIPPSSTLNDYPCAPDTITARGAVRLAGSGIDGDAPLPCNSAIEITQGGSANLIWADAGTCTLTQGSGATDTPARFVSKPAEQVLLLSHFGRGDCSLSSSQPVSIESCGYILFTPGENSVVFACDETQFVSSASNGGEVRDREATAVAVLTPEAVVLPRLLPGGPEVEPQNGELCQDNCPTAAPTTTRPRPSIPGPGQVAPPNGELCQDNCPTAAPTTTRPGPSIPGPSQVAPPNGELCQDNCPTTTARPGPSIAPQDQVAPPDGELCEEPCGDGESELQPAATEPPTGTS
jgi:hypothetical protein